MSGPNYKRIRVSHPITGETIKVTLHVFMWLVANGLWEKGQITTPDGYELHHKDFNPLHNVLSNLELLTHSEHKKVHWEYNHDVKAKALCERMKKIRESRTKEQEDAIQQKKSDTMKYLYSKQTEEQRNNRVAKARAAHQILTENDVREIRKIYPTLKGERGKVGELQRRFKLKSLQHLRAVASGRLFPNVV